MERAAAAEAFTDPKKFEKEIEPSRSKKVSTNRKGRDIGYALVISSCEGANNVEACTVTTPDAITAFAVPNPNCSSQSQSVFSGLVAYRVAPVCRSLGLLRTGNFLFSPTLSTVDGDQLKQLLRGCQRNFRRDPKYLWTLLWKTGALLGIAATACGRTNSMS